MPSLDSAAAPAARPAPARTPFNFRPTTYTRCLAQHGAQRLLQRTLRLTCTPILSHPHHLHPDTPAPCPAWSSAAAAAHAAPGAS
eukprot:scaffold68535_cov14-Tisochrysis_lutea.AAC.1